MTAALLLLSAAVLVAAAPRRAMSRPGRWPFGPRVSRAAVAPLAAVVLVPAVSLWAGPAVGLAVVVLGATVRSRHRGRRAARRGESQARAALTGLDVMVAELQVGAGPAAACAVAAEEIGNEEGAATAAVGDVFRRAAATARLGGSISAAFADADNASLRRVARVAELTDRYGLEVAALLDSLRRDLTGRLRFETHVRSSLAGARATATVLAALPIPGVALGQLMGAQPLAALFGTQWGGILLLVGVTLGCAGLLWSDAITERAAR